MSVSASTAALAASGCWAIAAIIGAAPARTLGSFAFTRIQLVTSTPLLAAMMLWTGAWSTIDLSYWPSILLSTFFGVVLGNLAMISCLRKGGPRRMQLLMALSPVFTVLISNIYLHEALTSFELLGFALTLTGIAIAVLFSAPADGNDSFETIEGSLLSVVSLGVVAAACHGIGVIVLKPMMLDGVAPIATSFLRTGAAAVLVCAIGLFPIKAIEARAEIDRKLLAKTVVPGVLGYVLAVSLLLYALSEHSAGIVSVLGATAPVLMLPMLWAFRRNAPTPAAWFGAMITTAGSAILLWQ